MQLYHPLPPPLFCHLSYLFVLYIICTVINIVALLMVLLMVLLIALLHTITTDRGVKGTAICAYTSRDAYRDCVKN